eukprot:Awhi_evm1s1767
MRFDTKASLSEPQQHSNLLDKLMNPSRSRNDLLEKHSKKDPELQVAEFLTLFNLGVNIILPPSCLTTVPFFSTYKLADEEFTNGEQWSSNIAVAPRLSWNVNKLQPRNQEFSTNGSNVDESNRGNSNSSSLARICSKSEHHLATVEFQTEPRKMSFDDGQNLSKSQKSPSSSSLPRSNSEHKGLRFGRIRGSVFKNNSVGSKEDKEDKGSSGPVRSFSNPHESESATLNQGLDSLGSNSTPVPFSERHGIRHKRAFRKVAKNYNPTFAASGSDVNNDNNNNNSSNNSINNDNDNNTSDNSDNENNSYESCGDQDTRVEEYKRKKIIQATLQTKFLVHSSQISGLVSDAPFFGVGYDLSCVDALDLSLTNSHDWISAQDKNNQRNTTTQENDYSEHDNISTTANNRLSVRYTNDYGDCDEEVITNDLEASNNASTIYEHAFNIQQRFNFENTFYSSDLDSDQSDAFDNSGSKNEFPKLPQTRRASVNANIRTSADFKKPRAHSVASFNISDRPKSELLESDIDHNNSNNDNNQDSFDRCFEPKKKSNVNYSLNRCMSTEVDPESLDYDTVERSLSVDQELPIFSAKLSGRKEGNLKSPSNSDYEEALSSRNSKRFSDYEEARSSFELIGDKNLRKFTHKVNDRSSFDKQIEKNEKKLSDYEEARSSFEFIGDKTGLKDPNKKAERSSTGGISEKPCTSEESHSKARMSTGSMTAKSTVQSVNGQEKRRIDSLGSKSVDFLARERYFIDTDHSDLMLPSESSTESSAEKALDENIARKNIISRSIGDPKASVKRSYSNKQRSPSKVISVKSKFSRQRSCSRVISSGSEDLKSNRNSLSDFEMDSFVKSSGTLSPNAPHKSSATFFNFSTAVPPTITPPSPPANHTPPSPKKAIGSIRDSGFPILSKEELLQSRKEGEKNGSGDIKPLPREELMNKSNAAKSEGKSILDCNYPILSKTQILSSSSDSSLSIHTPVTTDGAISDLDLPELTSEYGYLVVNEQTQKGLNLLRENINVPPIVLPLSTQVRNSLGTEKREYLDLPVISFKQDSESSMDSALESSLSCMSDDDGKNGDFEKEENLYEDSTYMANFSDSVHDSTSLLESIGVVRDNSEENLYEVFSKEEVNIDFDDVNSDSNNNSNNNCDEEKENQYEYLPEFLEKASSQPRSTKKKFQRNKKYSSLPSSKSVNCLPPAPSVPVRTSPTSSLSITQPTQKQSPSTTPISQCPTSSTTQPTDKDQRRIRFIANLKHRTLKERPKDKENLNDKENQRKGVRFSEVVDSDLDDSDHDTSAKGGQSAEKHSSFSGVIPSSIDNSDDSSVAKGMKNSFSLESLNAATEFLPSRPRNGNIIVKKNSPSIIPSSSSDTNNAPTPLKNSIKRISAPKDLRHLASGSGTTLLDPKPRYPGRNQDHATRPNSWNPNRSITPPSTTSLVTRNSVPKELNEKLQSGIDDKMVQLTKENSNSRPSSESKVQLPLPLIPISRNDNNAISQNPKPNIPIPLTPPPFATLSTSDSELSNKNDNNSKNPKPNIPIPITLPSVPCELEKDEDPIDSNMEDVSPKNNKPKIPIPISPPLVTPDSNSKDQGHTADDQSTVLKRHQSLQFTDLPEAPVTPIKKPASNSPPPRPPSLLPQNLRQDPPSPQQPPKLEKRIGKIDIRMFEHANVPPPLPKKTNRANSDIRINMAPAGLMSTPPPIPPKMGIGSRSSSDL